MKLRNGIEANLQKVDGDWFNQAGHDLHHTMKNYRDNRWQVFVLPHTEQLDRDIARLTGYEYEKNKRSVRCAFLCCG
ncbi:hypothetical protein [Neobacillus mesonae]|uniref:hypothetical protein n=1 Tax=Neobacillus mesonae TaxID=1193713 RepID=UPI001C573189|nr:hypothetical protein [Neobacillus mesonae]